MLNSGHEQLPRYTHDLSVVVPSVNGWTDLAPTLAALEVAAAEMSLRGETMEVVVVDRVGESVRVALRTRYAEGARLPVVLLEVAPQTPIPEMRLNAFRASHGRSVAVIEDHVRVPASWAIDLLEARRTWAVVGGAVENAATESLVDRAAFLCEYSHCLPPLPAGPNTWLTGNNVVYERALLDRYLGSMPANTWENVLHDYMRDDGVVLMCCPEIVVGHCMHYTVGLYCEQRYLYSRSFTGARLANASVFKRLIAGLASFALPPVLFYRIASRVLARPRYRGQLFEATPLLALFVCAWAWGDVVGAWFGPGDALSRVR